MSHLIIGLSQNAQTNFIKMKIKKKKTKKKSKKLIFSKKRKSTKSLSRVIHNGKLSFVEEY